MLILYTLRKTLRKRIENGTDILTVEVGEKSTIPEFRPSDSLRRKMHEGLISEEEFMPAWRDELLSRYESNPAPWLELIKRKHLAIMCDWKEGLYCWRHVFREVLRIIAIRNGVNLEYDGEIV